MSVKENIIEIKPLKIDINDIFDKKIELSPLLEFNLLQRIIQEFINRQNETNEKIKSLETKINYIKNMSTITPVTTFNTKGKNAIFDTIPDDISEDNDLSESQNLNKEEKKEEKNNKEEKKEEKETIKEEHKEEKETIKEEKKEEKETIKEEKETIKEEKETIKEEKETIKEEKESIKEGSKEEAKSSINTDDSKNITLLQTNKSEGKRTKALLQQSLTKASILENKFNELIDNFNLLKKENKKDIQSIKNKNKENTNKISELENKINELQNKKEEDIAALDIINDNIEPGEVDTDKVKVWIKNLEQKLIKKIEFSDKRNKNNEGSLNELKNEINNIKEKLNNFESMMSPKEEEVEEGKKENVEEDKKEVKNVFDNFITKEELNKLKNELQQKLEEMNKNISKNPLLNIDEKKLYESIIPKLNQMTDNLKENVTKSIENNEKYIKNQIKKLEIDLIKDEIKSVKKELTSKLNKENLGSINLKLEDMENVDENLRTMIDDNKNDIRLCNDKYSKLFKILETLRGQVLTLLEAEDIENQKGKDDFKLDLSLLVSKEEFDENREKINKKIEKIYRQETDNYRMIQELNKKIRNLVTETDLQNLEQYFLNLLSENKLKISKNFAERTELQKSLKFFDIRIKQLEETASKENENWLLAKKPMNGYLCASCEAYIGELKSKDDVATWNKLTDRKVKRNYRIGHGFSTMLKMMNTDLLKRIEKENNNNNSSINNSNISKQDEVHKIHNNLPKIKIPKNYTNINVNDTQNMNMNISNSEEINENLNNSTNNIKTQIQFEKSTLNLKGQFSDRAINKNLAINYNKDLTEEEQPKVMKILKLTKK